MSKLNNWFITPNSKRYGTEYGFGIVSGRGFTDGSGWECGMFDNERIDGAGYGCGNGAAAGFMYNPIKGSGVGYGDGHKAGNGYPNINDILQ